MKSIDYDVNKNLTYDLSRCLLLIQNRKPLSKEAVQRQMSGQKHQVCPVHHP